MGSLHPCPSCSRHVRATDAHCPFCEQPLSITTGSVPVPTGRLGRAAKMAFGAALATASLAGCDGKPPANASNPPEMDAATPAPTEEDAAATTAEDAAATTEEDTMPPPFVNQAKPYGAPPADGLLWV